jgi:hypothetical protein
MVRAGRDGRQRPRRLDPQGIASAREFIENMARYWPDRFDRLEVFLAETAERKQENDT